MMSEIGLIETVVTAHNYDYCPYRKLDLGKKGEAK